MAISSKSKIGVCAFCKTFELLRMSHAIPKAAFKPLLESGNGSAIAIPDGDADVHLTTDTGDALLLCERCEASFNQRFDGPMINALKKLDRNFREGESSASIEFDANHLAHALASVAWRINFSSSNFNSRVKLSQRHAALLESLIRLPSTEILKHCSVKLARLADSAAVKDRAFSQDFMGQIIKAPESFSIRIKPKGNLDRFAVDWSMFGFLIHVVAPRITYPKSRSFGGLKRGSTSVTVSRLGILDYQPLADAIVDGFKKNAEGKLSKGMKNRHRNERAT